MHKKFSGLTHLIVLQNIGCLYCHRNLYAFTKFTSRVREMDILIVTTMFNVNFRVALLSVEYTL